MANGYCPRCDEPLDGKGRWCMACKRAYQREYMRRTYDPAKRRAKWEREKAKKDG